MDAIEKIIDDFREEMRGALKRIENKVDTNLDAGFKHDTLIEDRLRAPIADHENRLLSLESAQVAAASVRQALTETSKQRFTTWQKVGIAAAVVTGVGGMFVAVAALVATVLIAYL